MTQSFKKCPYGEYPTVMVADEQMSISGEIQIHQRSTIYESAPTLENDGHRDVISMSRKQAIAVAYKILELTDGK